MAGPDEHTQARNALVCPVHGARPGETATCKAIVTSKLDGLTRVWCGYALAPATAASATPEARAAAEPIGLTRCPECHGADGFHTRNCNAIPAAEQVYMDPISEIHVRALERALAHAKRHPLSEEFHQLLKSAGDMHDAKQQDYGSASDPFANVRAASEWGMPGWVGAMVRVNDKVRRLQAFARKGVLKNESAEDSFMDIAVYALIALVLYREDGDAEAVE